MGLNDSTDVAVDAAAAVSSSTSRSPLPIDLNEIPSSSSPSSLPHLPEPDQSDPSDDLLAPVDIVRSFHDHPDPPPGAAAGLPRDGACQACGGSELQGHAVVCDGCERGYHLACVEKLSGRGCEAVGSSEWLCAECVSGGVKSKRWPLGFKSSKRMILDINASPPRDGEGDGEDELLHLRKGTLADNSSDGNAFGTPVTCSNLLYAGNGFGSRKGSGMMLHALRMGFGDLLHRDADRRLDEVNWGFPIGKCRSDDDTTIRLPSRKPDELFLQGLREFVSERNGVLEEGWRAELRHSTSSYELYVVYCSPDGKTFGSMSEVACHLGLLSVSNAMDIDRRIAPCSQLPERPHAYKRRKSKKNREVVQNGSNKHFSNSEIGVIQDGKLGKDTEVKTDDFGATSAEPSSDGFPVQFGDFVVMSLGKIDTRPSYHDAGQIWPVGYRSCWHDKITGSVFVHEVEDGGDSGPLFRIKRLSCSMFPIPDSSTVLVRKNVHQLVIQDSEESCGKLRSGDNENSGILEMLLLEHSPPTENDILNCLNSLSSECVAETTERLQNSSASGGSVVLSSDKYAGDYVGEISVEGQSTLSVWRIVIKKLIDAYSEIYKCEGKLRLSCNHADIAAGELAWVPQDGNLESGFAALTKFCSSRRYIDIPLVYKGEISLLTASLSKWLDQDRSGLDADFVQEMLEELPGVETCSKYNSLIHRSKHTAIVTIRNGMLAAKRKNGVLLDDLFHRSKKQRLSKDGIIDYPPGRLLCPKLPSSVLVGDIYQIWELLCRFHKILGLEEPLKLEELEEEIISPWSGWSTGGNNLKKIHGSQVPDILGVDRVNGQIQSFDDPHAFIPVVETKIATDAADNEPTSVNPCRCIGAALTAGHSALLGVLISELQSKVAVLVDPTLDSGDIKLKRGRRKDSDSAISGRRTKITMLPINELTWPELSRRFILAVLSMDGSLESAEILARESSKVFRCLLGDGGVLCGALTGVAGMEADALLLAEAMKKIYGTLSCEMDVITIEEEVTDASGGSESNEPRDVTMPEWAQVLEPVRKLPTNVGTRIRKCVNDAIEKCPPEWAAARLRHSISKEIYKGNASGPTKKAVLAVLAEVQSEILLKNSEKKNKRKITVKISDIVMKQCRIVLRRVAAADDGKVFCTLLGRNLLNSSDNDDEGLLGSPAMVSRPLDFRTIDLRLALGVYGTCHASFLEDVQELWENVRTVFRDQSDLCELVQTLSQNFESMYEKEVLELIQKLEGYAKMDQIIGETRKDLDNILASIKEIPKAPWDEGVCKVCGVDKDDDSVLLCDTCDAEYHTYCLNPPLARIPEGNWYCPSCVSGVCVIQQASRDSQVSGKSRLKKCRGEVTSVHLDKLGRLSAALREKEYWEITVDERIFLFKFLCDELLGSALIRQHLEQCVETSTELQQKLRAFIIEWKNMKSKEEFMALRATKMDSNSVVEKVVKDGAISVVMNQCSNVAPPANSSDEPTRCSQTLATNSAFNSCNDHNLKDSESNQNCSDQTVNLSNKSSRVKGLHTSSNGKNRTCQENSNSCELNQLSLAAQLVQEGDAVPESESWNSQGLLPTADMNESQQFDVELCTLKNDILKLKSSILSTELQLFRLSIRRDYLGSDSSGRIYWASALPGKHSCVIVDGTCSLEQREASVYRDTLYYTSDRNKLGTAKACFPFAGLKDASGIHSYWTVYESDSEIEELIGCLKNDDTKEKELKDSLMQLLRLRSLENQQTCNPVEAEHQPGPSLDVDKEKVPCSDVVTKAALFLVKKYGNLVQLEYCDLSNKTWEQLRMTDEDRTYRCQCLEPIWRSRLHCFCCHRTFSDDAGFKAHGDGKCNQTQQFYKYEESNCSARMRNNMTPGGDVNDCSSQKEIAETSKSSSDARARLVKFQNEVTASPYNFEDISTRFVTKDSVMELVQEIGLIGSKGVPSFLASLSPYVSDSTVMLISANDGAGLVDEMNIDASQADQPVSDNVSGKSAAAEINELARTKRSSSGCMERRDTKPQLEKRSPEIRLGHLCVVPASALRPLIGNAAPILRQLKINLLDMEAVLPEDALRASKSGMERRWAWRSFVKSAKTIYEMIQATIVLEDMIKRDYLRNEWWYWSSLSAAAKTSTVSSLALRICSLDSAIVYERIYCDSDPSDKLKPSCIPEDKTVHLDSVDKFKVGRRSNKKRKEPEG
ncbi:Methyl-CpG-binding domain-containing protein 9 [Linum perenne]